MSSNIKHIIQEVKHLNARERALIAHCLISSLETKQDEGVDLAWAELAEKRYTELVSGKVESVSCEVKASYHWYQEKADGLGEDFMNELEAAYQAII